MNNVLAHLTSEVFLYSKCTYKRAERKMKKIVPVN